MKMKIISQVLSKVSFDSLKKIQLFTICQRTEVLSRLIGGARGNLAIIHTFSNQASRQL